MASSPLHYTAIREGLLPAVWGNRLANFLGQVSGFVKHQKTMTPREVRGGG